MAKKAHTTMKEKLDKEIVKLTNRNKSLTTEKNKLETQNNEWINKTNIIKTTTTIGALGGPVGMVVGAATGVVVNEVIDAWKALKRWW
ncbi:MAG: hypothetical protein RP166_0420 [Rapeseed phyllody phytoplasma]|uniref:Uncharacterized protein n=1 Tax=Rapeseed phyllody phytoplasma TaxID=2490543 RepID=A0A859I931_9MOLU|nr:MAG: hypothetical protein RP166_0420 [Rapeseed phyllody phytoplasma]